MDWMQWSLGVLGSILVVPGFAGPAWAQAPTPSPGLSPSATPATDGGPASTVAVLAIVVGLIVAIGVAVKLFDLKRRREAEAVHLQAQISDALLREPSLFGAPITPTAHVPFWRGGPAVVEMTGQVPTPELRAAALAIARSEAARVRPDVQLEDRMSVVAEAPARAA